MGEIFERKVLWITAGAAVLKNGGICRGFTLLEVMVVVIIIGILATLAYSSLTEMIFINRAKETAQTIRTFTERALIDGKRMNKDVKISIVGNEIKAETEEKNGANVTYAKIASETLSQGFSEPPTSPPVNGLNSFNGGVKSQIRIGLSGIAETGYFAACFKGYCGGAVKLANENSFKTYIKKGSKFDWEVL